MRFQIKKIRVLSNFKTKFSERVRFCFENFFKNQILKKNMHSKNHVLAEFTPQNG